MIFHQSVYRFFTCNLSRDSLSRCLLLATLVSCETKRWKRPKEAWAERVCIFCIAGKVETEKHFILECEAFKDTRDRYANVLADKSWDDLFNEGTVEKLRTLIIKLNRQRIELQKTTCELVSPIGYS